MMEHEVDPPAKPPGSLGDLRLARRASDGDATAWDEIVARYGRRLYNLAAQFAGDLAEAEDLTQDIFVKLYGALGRYDGRAPLTAWALRLSRNLLIDHYRARRRRGLGREISDAILETLPAAADPQADALRRQRIAAVHQALDHLPEDLATPILLRDLQGLTYEETAEALDLPVGTVKSRVFRGRKELAREVDQLLAPRASVSTGALEAGSC